MESNEMLPLVLNKPSPLDPLGSLSPVDGLVYEDPGSLEEKETVYSQTMRMEFAVLLLAVMGGIAIVMAFFGNTIIIMCYVYNKKRNTAHTFHIFNLAVTDLIYCIFVMVPFYANQVASRVWLSGEEMCHTSSILLYASGFHSVFLGIVITSDRMSKVSVGGGRRSQARQLFGYPIVMVSWLLWLSIVLGLKLNIENKLLQHPSFQYNQDDEFMCNFIFRGGQEWTKFTLIILTMVPLATLLYLHVHMRVSEFAVQSMLQPRPIKVCPSDIIVPQGSSVTVDFPSQTLSGTVTSDTIDVEFGSLIRASLYRLPTTSYIEFRRIYQTNIRLAVKVRHLLNLTSISILVSWLPFYLVLCVGEWHPSELPGAEAYVCMWLYSSRAATNPHIYARNTSSFRHIFSRTLRGIRRHVIVLPRHCYRQFVRKRKQSASTQSAKSKERITDPTNSDLEEEHNISPTIALSESTLGRWFMAIGCPFYSEVLARRPLQRSRGTNQLVIPLSHASGSAEGLVEGRRRPIAASSSRERRRAMSIRSDRESREKKKQSGDPMKSSITVAESSYHFPANQDAQIYASLSESFIF